MRGRATLNKDFRNIQRQAVRTPILSSDVRVGDWELFATEDGHLAVHNLITGQVEVLIEATEPSSGT